MEPFAELAGLTAQAVLDDDAFAGLGAAYGRAIGASMCWLQTGSGADTCGVAAYHLPDALTPLYQAHFHKVSLLEDGLSARGPGVFTLEDLADPAVYECSEYLNDFLRPHCDGHYPLGITFAEPHHARLFSAFRARDRGDFTPRLRAMLAHLRVPLESMLMTRERLAAARDEMARIEAVLDCEDAMFLLSRDGQLLWCNRVGRGKDGRLRLRQTARGFRLQADDAATDRALSAAVRAATATPVSTTLCADGEVVHVDPFVEQGRVTGVRVLVVARQARAARAAARARSAFTLTDKEAAVLAGLLAGHCPAEIASTAGVGLATVRSHLHALYEKTGAASQAGLVALAAAMGTR